MQLKHKFGASHVPNLDLNRVVLRALAFELVLGFFKKI